MRRRLAVLSALALLLAVLLLPVPQGGAPDFRAARYTRIVDSLFLGTRIITLEQGARAADGGQISYHPPADAGQAQLADWYYKNSYLKGDVQRFNEGSPEGRALFALEHAQLARINPAAHTFRPSLEGRGRWLGRLLYADGGTGVSLSLRPLDDASPALTVLPLAHAFVEELQARHGYVSLFARTTPAARSGSILHFVTAGGREVAHVWGMGDGALLRLTAPEPESLVEIRIDGRPLHGAAGEVYALKPGSVLLFTSHRGQTRRERRSNAWLVQDALAGDVAYDGASGLWQRTPYDPLLARVQSLLADVAAAGPGDVDADVRLTLSRSAEEAAGRILAAALDRPGGTAAAPAAITLMDGMTGALLALPSWPPGPATPQAGSVPEQNQNFTRHAVGSVAKILLAPAVLDTNPALLRLALPPGGADGATTFSSVLGLPLGREVQDDSLARDHLDFAAAVAASSNRYAVALLTLGSVDPHVTARGSQLIADDADRYYLGGRLMDRRPAGLIFNPGAPDTLGVLGLPWVERLRHLLDINVATPPGEARLTRQYIWDALPAALMPRPGQRRMLDAVSPEYENLRMEAIRNRAGDFGTKFVSLTLGAGESRWSNVALAEAVASLIENRPVRAQLVAGAAAAADGEGGAPSFGFQPLGARTHQGLAQAMAAVVREGTASALEPARAALARAACLRGESFALFAKTGTPVLVEQHEAPEAALFNEMARDQLFRRNAAGEIVYSALSGADGEGGVLTYRDLAALTALRDHGAGPVAADFQHYFLPDSQSPAVQADIAACHEEGRATAWALWSRVMRMVAESNEAPGYAPVRSDGPVLSWRHACSTSRTADSRNINGQHIVMLAAVYPRPGSAAAPCGDAAPSVDVSRPPLRAVAAVVAIADPERMDRTLDVAARLLMRPVAELLGLAPDMAQPP